jgi:hypothetical protein
MRFKNDSVAERAMVAEMQRAAAEAENAEVIEYSKRNMVKPSLTGNRRQRRAAMARKR